MRQPLGTVKSWVRALAGGAEELPQGAAVRRRDAARRGKLTWTTAAAISPTRLAAEYVTGTLRGAARRRFECAAAGARRRCAKRRAPGRSG